MLVNRVLFFLALLVIATSVYGFPTWIKTFDGHGLNTIKFVLPLENGHMVFAATCDSTPTWDGTWLSEIDEDGNILWNYYNENTPLGLAEIDGEGYMLLTGFFSGEIIRLDLSGNEVWSIPTIYSTAGLQRTQDGHFVFPNDGLLCKIDSNGNTIWTVDPPQPEYISILGPSFCPSGGFAVAGSRYDPYIDYYMAGMADSLGNIAAVGEFEGPYDLNCLGVYADQEGSCFGIAQYYSSYPPPTSDEYVVRFDSNGDLNWWTSIPNTVAICQSADGNPVVTGQNTFYDGSTFFIRKIDPANGSYLWHVIQGNGTTPFSARCIALAADGGFIIGGTSSGLGTIAKTDSLGLINGMGIETNTQQSIVTISPEVNPSLSSTVNLQIQAPEFITFDLLIYDASGRVVHSSKIQSSNTFNQLTMKNLPAGVYTAVLMSETFGRASCRLAVLR